MDSSEPHFTKRPLPFTATFFVLTVVCFGFAGLLRLWNGAHPMVIEWSCLSNVKQLALGAIMYANDYDNKWPTPEKWMDLTQPYVKTESVYHDIVGVQPGEYGYAFRESAWVSEAKSFDGLERFALLFDSDLKGRNAHSELWSLPSRGRHGVEANMGSDNVAFADGHAKSFLATPNAADGRSSLHNLLMDNDRLTKQEAPTPKGKPKVR